MIETQSRSLKQLFDDNDYAWQLLEGQVKLQTSADVSSDDVSQLLQLYMKGVQKMNSFLDYRQAYFKQRVMTLMSRPTVMKTLNNKNIMSKKSNAAIANTEKTLSPLTSPEKNGHKTSSSKKIEHQSQILHLKQKKRQIQVRIAYGVQQNTSDALSKMLNEQNQKQQSISLKINKIVENHQEHLMKRIKQRKLKTLAAKSLSNAIINDFNGFDNHNNIKYDTKQQKNGKLNDYFDSCIQLNNDEGTKHNMDKTRKRYRSLSLHRHNKIAQQQSPLRRTISYNMAVHISKQNIKLWNFNGME